METVESKNFKFYAFIFKLKFIKQIQSVYFIFVVLMQSVTFWQWGNK